MRCGRTSSDTCGKSQSQQVIIAILLKQIVPWQTPAGSEKSRVYGGNRNMSSSATNRLLTGQWCQAQWSCKPPRAGPVLRKTPAPAAHCRYTKRTQSHFRTLGGVRRPPRTATRQIPRPRTAGIPNEPSPISGHCGGPSCRPPRTATLLLPPRTAGIPNEPSPISEHSVGQTIAVCGLHPPLGPVLPNIPFLASPPVIALPCALQCKTWDPKRHSNSPLTG